MARTQPLLRSAFDRADEAVRAARRVAFRSCYRFGAALYDSVVRDRLGYRAHEVAAAKFAEHWTGPAEGPVLDLGCGTGLAAESLAARLPTLEIDGLDSSAEMLTVARKKGLYRGLICADACRPLPVAPASYAGAISTGLYTHGHVGVDALEPVLATLAPGALFTFTVYSATWSSRGFGDAVEDARRAGRLEILSNERIGHFRRLRSQYAHMLAVRMAV